MPHTADVAILGSGFGGSLTALILHRIGLRIAVIDRDAHPRFAIGESSTPIADFVLRDLASRYDLPRFRPLCAYGSWKRERPEIACGLKRGFSYFRHDEHAPFVPDVNHQNELIVAASASDEKSDTHWFRADVDAFFADEVRNAGIALFENTDVATIEPHGEDWAIGGDNGFALRARFLIDATGAGMLLPRTLGVPCTADGFRTNSRALFSHFRGVASWESQLSRRGETTADHPFPCDHAALHHVFDDGWMWQLRFDNGITSAGFLLNGNCNHPSQAVSHEHDWTSFLNRFPSIAAQFENTELVDPPGRVIVTDRLQRRASRITGENWALLPHTAGFVDPLHSTGIAHTLCGIERLTGILERHWGSKILTKHLRDYETTVARELELIDLLVAGCYTALPSFELFTTWCMLYFAAATTYERRRAHGNPPQTFMLANDDTFRDVVGSLFEKLKKMMARCMPSPIQIEDFESRLARLIAPYNTVGLCDPSVNNMYRYTAAKP